MKTLILYYSYSGNTRKIAQMLQNEIGGDITEIKTAFPYKGDYTEVVNQGKQEIESGFLPEIQPINVDLEKYDTILLGTPVWWYTFASAVNTFLTENDLSGKAIYPFATNGGWVGHTFKDFESKCKGAHVNKGIDILFDDHTLKTFQDDIIAWVKSIK